MTRGASLATKITDNLRHGQHTLSFLQLDVEGVIPSLIPKCYAKYVFAHRTLIAQAAKISHRPSTLSYYNVQGLALRPHPLLHGGGHRRGGPIWHAVALGTGVWAAVHNVLFWEWDGVAPGLGYLSALAQAGPHGLGQPHGGFRYVDNGRGMIICGVSRLLCVCLY